MIQVKKITLTPAQIIASFATPVIILPAPPTNFVNNVLGLSVDMTFNTLAYTGAGFPEIDIFSTGVLPVYKETIVLLSTISRDNIFARAIANGNPWTTTKNVKLATSVLMATG